MSKRKIIAILFILILFTSGFGMAYSYFNSGVNLSSNAIPLAKFIFNTENLDEFQLSLIDLIPGDTKEYTFSVNNNNSGVLSDITLEYQIIIKTYNFIPLTIELYKIIDENEELFLTCNEEYTRNDKNEIICNAPIQELLFSTEAIDNYKLKINFSSEYDGFIYSNLVDFVNVEIKSWQKIGE